MMRIKTTQKKKRKENEATRRQMNEFNSEMHWKLKIKHKLKQSDVRRNIFNETGTCCKDGYNMVIRK